MIIRAPRLVRPHVLHEAPEIAAAGLFTEALFRHGVIGRTLGYANSVAFSPPLIISDEEVDELVATAAALAELG